jgi:polysaccharide deacetylase 2 family uncharacterized protein YibQ
MLRRPPDLRAVTDYLFFVLIAVAICAGGGTAVEGLSKFFRSLAPLPATATARSESATTALLLRGFDAPTSYRPALLSPIAAHAAPLWLSATPSAIAKRAGAAAGPLPTGRQIEIAIVIDDLGVDVASTRQAIALPAWVNLSFLPYASETPVLAREAEQAGHEVLVHVPMEPIGAADPGPMALQTGLGGAENVRRLNWALSRVPGFAGINNHMGSRFTADRESLAPVIAALSARGVYFLDSRTTAASIVVPLARACGLASADRDVFLDDEPTPSSVAQQLAAVVRRARETGVAIAIGHPHPATLAILRQWLPGAQADNIALVSAGRAIRDKAARDGESTRQKPAHST